MTAIIPFGQKVALRVEKYSISQNLHSGTKYISLKLIHFRKSNKESIKLNQFEDMTQAVEGCCNFFTKVLSGSFSSKDFFNSGKIVVYFAPKLSNQNYWISKPTNAKKFMSNRWKKDWKPLLWAKKMWMYFTRKRPHFLSLYKKQVLPPCEKYQIGFQSVTDTRQICLLKRIIELLCKRSIEVKEVGVMRTLHIMPSKNLE